MLNMFLLEVQKTKNTSWLKNSGEKASKILIDLDFSRSFDCFSYEALENFARRLAQGVVEPYLKSQPVPEQTADVKVVVAKNFDEIVNDKSKDVLIEFYAPW